MNRLRVANMPVSTCTSFGLLGNLRRFTTSIWSGLTSIPQLVIRLPPRKHTYPYWGATYVIEVLQTTPRDPLCVVPLIYFSPPYRQCTPPQSARSYLRTFLSSSVDMWPWHSLTQRASRYNGVGIRGDKCCLFLILGSQSNLVITLKGIQNTHPRVPIHPLIDRSSA